VNPNGNRPSLTAQRWTGNQLRISWPSSFTGFSVQQSSSPANGWVTTGLSITQEGSEWAAYVPISGTSLFLGLKQ
jgi:hypothetical protein